MLRFRSSTTSPTAADIRLLRACTDLGIAEIRSRAAEGKGLFEIVPFAGDWKANRRTLARIAAGIRDGSLPLVAAEVYQNGREEPLTDETLWNRLHHYRQIELETQRDADLESGEIAERDEFQPWDEDWTEHEP